MPPPAAKIDSVSDEGPKPLDELSGEEHRSRLFYRRASEPDDPEPPRGPPGNSDGLGSGEISEEHHRVFSQVVGAGSVSSSQGPTGDGDLGDEGSLSYPPTLSPLATFIMGGLRGLRIGRVSDGRLRVNLGVGAKEKRDSVGPGRTGRTIYRPPSGVTRSKVRCLDEQTDCGTGLSSLEPSQVSS